MLDLEAYRIENLEDVRTPALAIYPEFLDNNIRVTLDLLGGDPNRWRPHVKTVKMGFAMRRLAQHGVKQVKCATTLELIAALDSGMEDALLAYSLVGANARRLREIAASRKERIGVLVENAEQAKAWAGSGVGVFIDVNSGMNRTGLEQDRIDEVVALANALGEAFRGLHYYDGHMHIADFAAREKAAHAGYSQLMKLAEAVIASGRAIPEVITSGTPALVCGASFAPFRSAPFVHRVSPGTVSFCDTMSLQELPPGYKPAAVVIASVVSHPIANRFTCDAGHKAVSADAGVPTCAVIGHEDSYTPLKPSEEHLPVDVAGEVPAIGGHVYLVPRHVCPTVNNFDHAMIVENHRVAAVEPVTSRGHEAPIG